jgi:hypothetical protein
VLVITRDPARRSLIAAKLGEEVDPWRGNRSAIVFPNGAQVLFLSHSSGAGCGMSVDRLFCDVGVSEDVRRCAQSAVARREGEAVKA